MKPAALSVEVGHIYLSDLRDLTDEKEAVGRVADRIAAAEPWVRPIIDRYRDSQHAVTCSVMVDDYFWSEDQRGVRPRRLAEMLMEHSQELPLEIDHIVFEGALAESVEKLQRSLRPRPSSGTGSAGEVTAVGEAMWVTNGHPPPQEQMESRPRLGMSPSVQERKPAYVDRRREHSIRIDVEVLARDAPRPWACPTLAAWWQLVRLGMLRDTHNTATKPSGTISRVGAPPLHAYRTLTVLGPEFLEVEVAVRVVLEQFEFPEPWLADLRDSSDAVTAATPLERIAYIFADHRFHAFGLR